MTPIEVKISLLERGLTIADLARNLTPDGQSEEAMRVRLSQLIHGHRWFPKLAARLAKKYGIRLERSDRGGRRNKPAKRKAA